MLAVPTLSPAAPAVLVELRVAHLVSMQGARLLVMLVFAAVLPPLGALFLLLVESAPHGMVAALLLLLCHHIQAERGQLVADHLVQPLLKPPPSLVQEESAGVGAAVVASRD